MSIEDLSSAQPSEYRDYIDAYRYFLNMMDVASRAGPLVCEYLNQEAVSQTHDLHALSAQTSLLEEALEQGPHDIEMYKHLLSSDGASLGEGTRQHFLDEFRLRTACAVHLVGARAPEMRELDPERTERIMAAAQTLGKIAMGGKQPKPAMLAVGEYIDTSSVGGMLREPDIKKLVEAAGGLSPDDKAEYEKLVRAALDMRVVASNGEGELVRSKDAKTGADQYMILHKPGRPEVVRREIDHILSEAYAFYVLDMIINTQDEALQAALGITLTDRFLNEQARGEKELPEMAEGELGLFRAVSVQIVRELMLRPLVVVELLRNLNGRDPRHRLLELFVSVPDQARFDALDILEEQIAPASERPKRSVPRLSDRFRMFTPRKPTEGS